MAHGESDALMLYNASAPQAGAMVVLNPYTKQEELDGFQEMVNELCETTVRSRFNPRVRYRQRRVIEAEHGAQEHQAIVFRAVRPDGKTVVVKCKQPQPRRPGEEDVPHFGPEDEFMFNMFELNFCRRLCMSKHPNIVQFLGAWAFRSTREVFLEFEDSGTPLSTVIVQHGNRVPMADAARYLNHIFSALSTIHTQSTIHADVKEENILVRDGVARLGDFGVARDTGLPFKPVSTMFNTADPRRLPVLINDSRHRSYELLAQAAFATCAVDVYALGCVLVKMIAGDAAAFQTHDPDRQVEAMQSYSGPLPNYAGPPVPVVGVAAFFPGAPWTPPLADLATRMLAWDPAQRIAASAALEHEFFYSLSVGAGAPTDKKEKDI